MVPRRYSVRGDSLGQQAPSSRHLSASRTGAVLTRGCVKGDSTQESVVAEQARL